MRREYYEEFDFFIFIFVLDREGTDGRERERLVGEGLCRYGAA